MRTLPYDYFRCCPESPDHYCQNCKRWEKLDGQTFNPHGQSFCSVENSKSEACSYIPISFLEKK